MDISFLQLVDLFKVNLAGILTALVMCPATIWFTRRCHLLDVPGQEDHKQHQKTVPLAGGIVIAAGAVILTTIFRLWRGPYSALLLAASIVFVFGLWDDAKGVSAPVKFLGQLLASIILILSGTSVQFLNGLKVTFLGPFWINILQWFITIFWLTGISNSINMIDSMDGLASGIAAIAFAFFMAMGLVAKQTDLALFSAIFMGICIGIFVFNVRPARLFLGDSGAQTIGFILAAVAVLYVPENLPQGSSWFVPIMVLGVPIFDTVLVIVSRFRRQQSIFKADLTHTYHRLVALGMDPNRAIVVIHIATLGLCFMAFIALSLPPLPAFLIFLSAVVAGILLLIYFETSKMDFANL